MPAAGDSSSGSSSSTTSRKTPVSKVPEGHDVIFEIDVAGGERIAKIHPDPLLVFVDAPDQATQAERMRLRGNDPEEKIRRRLEHAESEVSAQPIFPTCTSSTMTWRPRSRSSGR